MRIVLFIILSSSLIELHLIYVFPVSDCQRRRCTLRNHHAFFGRDDSISSKVSHPAFSVTPTDSSHPTLCYDRRPTPLLQDLSHSHRKSSAGNSVVGWSLAVLLGMNKIGGKTWHCCPNIYHLHLLEKNDASHTQVVKQIQWDLRMTVIPLHPMVALLPVAALPKTLTVTDDCVSAVFRGGHPLNFSPILIPWVVSSCSMWMIMTLPLHSAGLTLSNIFAPSSALYMSFFVNSPWAVCLPSFLCCCVSWLVFFTYKSNFSTGSSLMGEILWHENQLSSVLLAEVRFSYNKLQSRLSLFSYCKTVLSLLWILWWPHWTESAWSPDFSVAWRSLWLYFLPA